MVVGIAVAELHIPAARGLKEKRKVIKGLIDRLSRRYRISIAETDFHDLRQRAEIGMALVGPDAGRVEHLCDEIRRHIDSLGEAVLTRWHLELVEGSR